MRNATAPDSYDAASIVLHWVTAFLVIAIFALAISPGIVRGSIALHSTLGLLLLIIVPLRAVWRFVKGGEVKRTGGSPASRAAAMLAHGLLYLLLVGIPLLGLIYIDAKGVPFKPFGIALPQIAYYNRELAQTVYLWKTWLSYFMLGLILLHAVAAIAYHHYVRKDEVLRSMIVPPERVAEQTAAPAVEPQAETVPAVFPRRSFLTS